MRWTVLAFSLLASVANLTAQINDAEVWVGTLDMSGGRFAVSNLMNISNHPGYDNQPAFFPDGKRLVFTSQIAVLDETGHAVQATIHDFATNTSTPVPGALGFSPTPAADGSLMLLREGRVWRHDASGKATALTETNDAGYFARFDERIWVLFMNDKQRRIVIYDATTKALDTMATGASTAPIRVPGKQAVTFVAVEPFPARRAKRRSPGLHASLFSAGSISTTGVSRRLPPSRFLLPEAMFGRRAAQYSWLPATRSTSGILRIPMTGGR
jgi:hypothetical protein